MQRRPKTVAFWVGRLPHWEVEDGRYFVTLHLRGAIPPAGIRRVREISRQLQHTQARDVNWIVRARKVFAEMESWLDRTGHARQLEQPAVAEMVAEAIQTREARGKWRVFRYVIMPSHLHLFFELGQPGLKECLEDFKRWTSHQAGKLLPLRGKRFWQREWFDHWSRSDPEDDRIDRYICQNPEKAGLVAPGERWPYLR